MGIRTIEVKRVYLKIREYYVFTLVTDEPVIRENIHKQEDEDKRLD